MNEVIGFARAESVCNSCLKPFSFNAYKPEQSILCPICRLKNRLKELKEIHKSKPRSCPYCNTNMLTRIYDLDWKEILYNPTTLHHHITHTCLKCGRIFQEEEK